MASFKGMKNIVFALLLLLLLKLLMDISEGGRTDFKNLGSSAVKSVQSEDGDTIDCVEIYKQPAFNHPLLQNHTIQMEPSFHLKKFANISSMPNAWPVQQLWQKSGNCPEGTIPIRRSREADLKFSEPQIEYAEYYTDTLGTFNGANARLNVWKVNVEPKEFSLNYVKISNEPQDNLIEVGWGAYPELFGDDRTRLYCYWMAQGLAESGCYNLQCPGFVQVDWKIALGAGICPLSTYNGRQAWIDLRIIKDKANNNWWLFIFEKPIGYWPESIFTDLRAGTIVSWGGSVYNAHRDETHTATQLGSGHSAFEGLGRAAFMAYLLYISTSGEWEIPFGYLIRVTNHSYYNFTYPLMRPELGLGFSFFYGGSGSQNLG